MLKEIDETICPFSRSKNQCMAHVEEPCWCNNADVPPELKAIALKETQGKVYICLSCIESFKDNPVAFKKRYSTF